MTYYSNRGHKNTDSSYKGYNRETDRYKNEPPYPRHDRHSPRQISHSKEDLDPKDRGVRTSKTDYDRYYKDSNYDSGKPRKDYPGEKRDYYVSSYKSTHY